MSRTKSNLAATVIGLGLFGGAAYVRNALTLHHPPTANHASQAEETHKAFISGDLARRVWDSIKKDGGAQVVSNREFDRNGNLLVEWIVDVETYNAVGTENGDPAGGRVAMVITYSKPHPVYPTVVLPIVMIDPATGKQTEVAHFFDRAQRDAEMAKLEAAYGNIYQYGKPRTEKTYPPIKPARFAASGETSPAPGRTFSHRIIGAPPQQSEDPSQPSFHEFEGPR